MAAKRGPDYPLADLPRTCQDRRERPLGDMPAATIPIQFIGEQLSMINPGASPGRPRQILCIDPYWIFLRPGAQRHVSSSVFRAVVAAWLLAVFPAGNDPARAADSNAVPAKTPPVADASLFSVNDNYLTYSYLPKAPTRAWLARPQSSFTRSVISTCGLTARTSPTSNTSSRTIAIRLLPAATTMLP